MGGLGKGMRNSNQWILAKFTEWIIKMPSINKSVSPWLDWELNKRCNRRDRRTSLQAGWYRHRASLLPWLFQRDQFSKCRVGTWMQEWLREWWEQTGYRCCTTRRGLRHHLEKVNILKWNKGLIFRDEKTPRFLHWIALASSQADWERVFRPQVNFWVAEATAGSALNFSKAAIWKNKWHFKFLPLQKKISLSWYLRWHRLLELLQQ